MSTLPSELVVLAPGTRLYRRRNVCGLKTCLVCGGTGRTGQGHGQRWELHLPGNDRRYIGQELVGGRENLPLLVERGLIEMAEDGTLPAQFKVDAGKLARRQDCRQIAELVEAVERAEVVLEMSRFIVREHGLLIGDLLVLPRAVVKALASAQPLLLVALPTGPGLDQHELVSRVRDIIREVRGEGGYEEAIGGALRLASKVSANPTAAIEPLADYYDERLVLFTLSPDAEVLARLGALAGEKFAAKLRARRAQRARPSYSRPPRRVRLVLPLVMRVNDPDSHPTDLLRLDRQDEAALADLTARLATGGVTYPVPFELVRRLEPFESQSVTQIQQALAERDAALAVITEELAR